MKAWLIGILLGGFFGFTIALLAFLLGLTNYGEDSKNPLIHVVQIIIIIVFGWFAWKAEGVKTLVGYVLGSFYIVRLIIAPGKANPD